HLALQRSGYPRHLHSFPTRRSSDLAAVDEGSGVEERVAPPARSHGEPRPDLPAQVAAERSDQPLPSAEGLLADRAQAGVEGQRPDRKSTRLNSSHLGISYAVFRLKK